MARCTGKTRAGKRCKNAATIGKTCATHAPKKPAKKPAKRSAKKPRAKAKRVTRPPAAKAPQVAAQCAGRTASGTQCKHRAIADGYCGIHKQQKPSPKKVGRGQCQAYTADGDQCGNKAAAGGFCGRHRSLIDSPDAWQALSVSEVERRKQYALLRRRELEVAEQEGRLVDADVARSECLRISSVIQSQIATIAARRSHAIAAKLGVKPGDVAAVLEVALREELKELADNL